MAELRITRRQFLIAEAERLAGKGIAPTGKCFCGCGGRTTPGRYFLAGHDRKAVTELIDTQYGTVVEFLAAHNWPEQKTED